MNKSPKVEGLFAINKSNIKTKLSNSTYSKSLKTNVMLDRRNNFNNINNFDISSKVLNLRRQLLYNLNNTKKKLNFINERHKTINPSYNNKNSIASKYSISDISSNLFTNKKQNNNCENKYNVDNTNEKRYSFFNLNKRINNNINKSNYSRNNFNKNKNKNDYGDNCNISCKNINFNNYIVRSSNKKLNSDSFLNRNEFNNMNNSFLLNNCYSFYKDEVNYRQSKKLEFENEIPFELNVNENICNKILTLACENQESFNIISNKKELINKNNKNSSILSKSKVLDSIKLVITKQNFEINKDNFTNNDNNLSLLTRKNLSSYNNNCSILSINNCENIQIDISKRKLEKINNNMLAISNANKDLKLSKKEIESLNNEIVEMKNIISNNELVRSLMHQQIESLRGNVRVYLRIKPSTLHESKNILSIVNQTNNNNNEPNLVTLRYLTKASNKPIEKDNIFTFDKVYSQINNQKDIFENFKPMIISALDGENICLFAYGATGSGKTYTMKGNTNCLSKEQNNMINLESGLLPRSAVYLMEELERRKKLDNIFNMYISALEIYNENVYDLLQNNDKLTEKDKDNIKKNLKPKNIKNKDSQSNDIKDKKTIVNGSVTDLNWKEVSNTYDIINTLNRANSNRSVECTAFNSESSRSHAIFQIKITNINTNKYSLINIIDLAGSEKSLVSNNLNKSNEDIEKMKKIQKEASCINKSLTTLKRIISIIAEKDKQIPPYRESKLTMLLQNSLNVNSKIALIVTVKNEEDSYYQTKDSLCFAKSAMYSV